MMLDLQQRTLAGALKTSRVVGIVAYGFDLLDFGRNFQHLHDSLKFYAIFNVTSKLQSPQFQRLTEDTDPFYYRERLTMPKLLLCASNDEVLALDDTTGRTASARRDFRFVVRRGSKGCTAPIPKIPGTYEGKFELCVQAIPFFLHTISPPTHHPEDGLWHFSSTVTDVPKNVVAWLSCCIRAMELEIDNQQCIMAVSKNGVLSFLLWKDTGNRMRAKEPGGWWTGISCASSMHLSCFSILSFSLSQEPDNMATASKGLVLFFAPDDMHNAHKGLVLFFVGAGLNDHGGEDWSYHIPKDTDVFIRVAAP
ncbi:unnamed protein product [Closterium sp. Yama58-4]|nr:unnamed protein product [Closterium sp. Yama58-4]